MSRNRRASTSWNPRGLYKPVQELLCHSHGVQLQWQDNYARRFWKHVDENDNKNFPTPCTYNIQPLEPNFCSFSVRCITALSIGTLKLTISLSVWVFKLVYVWANRDCFRPQCLNSTQGVSGYLHAPPGKEFPAPFNMRLCGPRGRSRHFGEQNLFLRGIEPWIVKPVAFVCR